MNTKKWTITVVLVLGLIWAGSALYAAPAVDWNPKKMNTEAIAGEEQTQTVTFKAGKDLSDVDVFVTPSLDGVLSVEPAELGNVAKGEERELSLIFSPSADSELEILDGTIHLRTGTSTHAKPLPVTVEVVWPEAGGDDIGFVVSYPPGLIAEEVVNSSEKKVLFYSNSEHIYDDNAFLLIGVVSLGESSSVREYLNSQSVKNEDIEEVVVNNRSYLRYVTTGMSDNMTAYSTSYPGNSVLSVVLVKPGFEQTEEFQMILESIDF